MQDFSTTTMTAAQIDDILGRLGRDYRLLVDSAGLLGLYVQIPDDDAEAWVERFWDAYATLAHSDDGVARPFDADNVQFLSASDIANDPYLEHLFQKPQQPIELPAPHLQHWIQPEQMQPKLKPEPCAPHRVAFYSYKGGVGRSTTMALVALTLASQGKNVVLVDFDLEAPGLATMLLKPEETPERGLVDYLSEWPALYNQRNLGEKERDLHRKRLVNEFLGELELNLPGTISVMPAGKVNADYPEKLAYASLEHIERMRPEENPIEALFIDLAAAVRDVNYILIDSRTGIADIGGSLLFKYADVTCACFYGDGQNREGMDLLAQYVIRCDAPKRPDLLWVHTKSPVPQPGVHEQMVSCLTHAYERDQGGSPPHLYQVIEHEGLRRVDRAKFDRIRPHQQPEMLRDIGDLVKAIESHVSDHA